MGLPGSPSLSPQSSQPSTTSPFKQEVFVYSPSPSSESPSLGAAATPIIMSRSPTGGWCLAGGVDHVAGGGGAVAWPQLVRFEPQARSIVLFAFQPQSVRASSSAGSPHLFITLQRLCSHPLLTCGETEARRVQCFARGIETV